MTNWIDTMSEDWHQALKWPGRILGRLADSIGIFTIWQERAEGRRQLLALDERMLRDIAISRADAVNEASKPFWRE